MFIGLLLPWKRVCSWKYFSLCVYSTICSETATYCLMIYSEYDSHSSSYFLKRNIKYNIEYSTLYIYIYVCIYITYIYRFIYIAIDIFDLF